MASRKTKIFFVAMVIVGLIFSTTACTKGGDTSAIKAYKKEKIIWWRVFDNESSVKDIISAYRQLHPNVTIEYRKLRYDEYEKELIDALAEDRGPDIMSLHNTWLPRYQTKLLPMPPKTVTPIKYMKGSVKKEEVVEFVTKKSLTAGDVRKKFLQVVADDVIINDEDRNEQVWGLPLNMDTLVMYYNNDLLNNAGIAEPPATWTDFQEQVKKITKIDESTGEILVSGAAMGTATNVARSFDILSLLMMQNLAPMIDESGTVTFDKMPKQVSGLASAPGLGALEYYVQFASPLYEGYCWNDKMPGSLEAFINGKAAYFFGYAYDREQILAQAPKLNFGIAPVPQVGQNQKVNYANYWVEAVSNKTKIKDYVWDFVQFMADEKNVVTYLDKSKKATALRSTKLINAQLADDDLAVFADQILTAKSWYRGESPAAAEQIFSDMVNATLSGGLTSKDALKQAAEKMNYSYLKKL